MMQLPATLSDLCKWSPLRRELAVGSFPCCCLRVILAPFVDPAEKVLHFSRLTWLYSQGHSLHPKVLTISYVCKILFLYKAVCVRFRSLGHESLHRSHYCTFHKEGSPVVTPNCPCFIEVWPWLLQFWWFFFIAVLSGSERSEWGWGLENPWAGSRQILTYLQRVFGLPACPLFL